jgi:Fic family protein
MLFTTPPLDDEDLRTIAEIDKYRASLRHFLREPRRWSGLLSRNLRARAIRGSNSIEGIDVSLDDAIALLDGDEPLDADHRTSLEIIGYRNALTYVQQLADDQHFALDESLLRSLHFMMLGHDLSKSPGRYRHGEIFVYDEERQVVVYEGPASERVPELMGELVSTLSPPDSCPVFVRAAMAHLNLVMIHPFRDGNGRMARALQTLVLARGQILAPEFSSIEEWLGRNTAEYYSVLTQVGAGARNPDHDAHMWVRFNLYAHHLQAQTVLRRVSVAEEMWGRLLEQLQALKLPERAALALYDAAAGLRVRRSTYARDAELEPATAARDLRMMVRAGLLESQGETRARIYVAAPPLRELRAMVNRERSRLINPYADVDVRTG